MELKFDTKEKFHVITIPEAKISANMTEALGQALNPLLEGDVKNVVLNLRQVAELDQGAAEALVRVQQHFYDHQASFVICCLSPDIERSLDEQGLLELMNVTPTESEAWDIVQMEEIEREFLDEGGE